MTSDRSVRTDPECDPGPISACGIVATRCYGGRSTGVRVRNRARGWNNCPSATAFPTVGAFRDTSAGAADPWYESAVRGIEVIDRTGSRPSFARVLQRSARRSLTLARVSQRTQT